jgi:hypothetical protein
MMRSRLAHWIVDRYPRDWRERYRDEVRVLLDDGPMPSELTQTSSS